MTNDGKNVRVAKGIYCYPKIDRRLELGVIYPTLDEIARAVARRDRERIAPAGTQSELVTEKMLEKSMGKASRLRKSAYLCTAKREATLDCPPVMKNRVSIKPRQL